MFDWGIQTGLHPTCQETPLHLQYKKQLLIITIAYNLTLQIPVKEGSPLYAIEMMPRIQDEDETQVREIVIKIR